MSGSGSGPDEAAPVAGRISPAEAQASLRLGISIILALLLAGPSLLAAARGEREFTSGAWWFLVSFVVARVAVGVLWSIWGAYRRTIDDAVRARETDALVRELDRRRAERTAGDDGESRSAGAGLSQ